MLIAAVSLSALFSGIGLMMMVEPTVIGFAIVVIAWWLANLTAIAIANRIRLIRIEDAHDRIHTEIRSLRRAVAGAWDLVRPADEAGPRSYGHRGD